MEFTDDEKKRASLAAKLAQVYQDVQYVQKTGENEHHGYTYAEEAEIVREIRLSLENNGVFLFHSQPESKRESNLTTTYHEYLFVCTDTGGWARCRWQGTGYDKRDKGIYKAHTGATKYFLMKTFLLPTGDDAERDYEEKHLTDEERKARRQKERTDTLAQIHEAIPDGYEEALEAMCSLWGLDSVDDATVDQLHTIHRKVSDRPHDAPDGERSEREKYLEGIIDKANDSTEDMI